MREINAQDVSLQVYQDSRDKFRFSLVYKGARILTSSHGRETEEEALKDAFLLKNKRNYILKQGSGLPYVAVMDGATTIANSRSFKHLKRPVTIKMVLSAVKSLGLI